MSTWPWSPRAEDEITGAIGFRWTASLILDAAPQSEIPLDVVQDGSADIQIGENVTPHWSGTIQVHATDQATLDLLNATKTDRRVRVSAGYVYQSGQEDVHVLCELLIRERTVNRPENTVTLTLQGDEVMVMDWAPLSGVVVVTADQTISGAVTMLLGAALPYVPLVTYGDSLDTGALVGTSITISPGEGVWSTIEDLLDRADADLYHNGLGDRRWVLTNRPATVGKSSAVLRVGPGGTIESSETMFDRGDWANAVTVKWKNDLLSWASAQGAGHARKVQSVDRSALVRPPDGGIASAAALLKRALSRGRSTALTAVLALWVRPGDTVTLGLPVGDQERVLVSNVKLNLNTARMSIQTRTPDVSPITAGGS